jgi:GNAT superfamily N-acetyltransferase
VPDLYVAERYRRWGLARALLDACVREAKRRGCLPKQSKPPGEGWPSLGGLLESGHQREAVHRLYERYGFVHGGRTYGLPLP